MAIVLEFAPGLLVEGSLRLNEPLGRGGMGSVWIAEDIASSPT